MKKKKKMNQTKFALRVFNVAQLALLDDIHEFTVAPFREEVKLEGLKLESSSKSSKMQSPRKTVHEDAFFQFPVRGARLDAILREVSLFILLAGHPNILRVFSLFFSFFFHVHINKKFHKFKRRRRYFCSYCPLILTRFLFYFYFSYMK